MIQEIFVVISNLSIYLASPLSDQPNNPVAINNRIRIKNVATELAKPAIIDITI